MFTDPNATHESRVRSLARQIGYRVKKSRSCNLHSNNGGKYMLVDGNNTIVEGASYDSELADIERAIFSSHYAWMIRNAQPLLANC